jgi:hypothetical protein
MGRLEELARRLDDDPDERELTAHLVALHEALSRIGAQSRARFAAACAARIGGPEPPLTIPAQELAGVAIDLAVRRVCDELGTRAPAIERLAARAELAWLRLAAARLAHAAGEREIMWPVIAAVGSWDPLLDALDQPLPEPVLEGFLDRVIERAMSGEYPPAALGDALAARRAGDRRPGPRVDRATSPYDDAALANTIRTAPAQLAARRLARRQVPSAHERLALTLELRLQSLDLLRLLAAHPE